MAHADWNWGTSALILRPEEPLLPTRLEMRVSWYTPDHFDLAGVLWTAWPDLNYIRFRIHEVRSLYRIDQHNGHVTLLIRPHRWGLTFESRVIAVEVVRLQWNSIISRMTAHFAGKHVTPRAIVQACRIRDCAVFPCEVQKDGVIHMPDERLILSNGDLITVVVRSGRSVGHLFTIPSPPFEAGWDPRRWRSQEQPFLIAGSILVFRLADRSNIANSRISIPIETWHNWEVAYRRIEQQWPDMRYIFLKKVNVHASRRFCPELADNVEAIVLEERRGTPDHCTLILICRDRDLDDVSIWSQKLAFPNAEAEMVELCGWTDICQRSNSLCTVSWNGRPVRFVDQIFPYDGDILEVEIEGRQPFCLDSGLSINSGRYDSIASQSAIADTQEVDHMMLLQLHNAKSKIRTRKGPAGEIGELYPISCSCCPCLFQFNNWQCGLQEVNQTRQGCNNTISQGG